RRDGGHRAARARRGRPDAPAVRLPADDDGADFAVRAPEDWGDPALNQRIDRAARELVLLMESGFARKIKDESWPSYQHEYGSAGGTEVSIDLDTDLMRLAAGGSTEPGPPGQPGT